MIRASKLQRFKENPDITVLIVGAGINGAGLFRELALQGVGCLLIDKADFMSGASAAPSRMIHGGLRYLENREVRLVKESLKERNLLLQNAPHYVRPLPTMIPIYHWFSGIVNGVKKFLGLKNDSTPRGAIIVRLGLLMYDIYTRKQRKVPTHAFSNRAQSLRDRPLLDPKIVGTALFYDAWIAFPERLGIELIQDAVSLNPDSFALNYLSLQSHEDGGVILRDELSGEEIDLSPRVVVNATGAWIDFTNESLGPKTRFIGGTKGSHLMIANDDLMRATRGQMVYYENDEGRICILFPLHGKVMVGSTDLKIDDPDEAVCTDDEVGYMLDCVRQVFPKLDIDPSQIVFRYSGVRPLPQNEAGLNNAQISRDHSIRTLDATSHRSFPVLNLIGGKWTTFRAFSEQAADQVLNYLSQSRKLHSHELAIGGGKNFPKTEIEKVSWIARLAEATKLSRERIEMLLFRYGTKAENIAHFLAEQPDFPLNTNPSYTRREVEFLFRNEWVEHLDDLILRRTVMALAGEMSLDLLSELAGVQAQLFNFSEEKLREEITRTLRILEEKHGVKLTKVKDLTDK